MHITSQVVPSVFLCCLIGKLFWDNINTVDDSRRNTANFTDGTIGTVYNRKCNTTVLFTNCTRPVITTWGMNFIYRNLHACIGNCTCYNLYVNDYYSSLCDNSTSSWFAVERLVVGCRCRAGM